MLYRLQSVPSPRRKRVTVRYQSLALSGLDHATTAKSVETLHLSTRAVHALEKSKVRTVGELIAAADEGLESRLTPGTQCFAEADESLHVLSECLDCKGDPNWEWYAVRRGFLLLSPPSSSKDFIRHFAEAIRVAIELQFGEEDLIIFDQYLMQIKKSRLAPLGKELKLTRQGVNFLKQRLLRALRGAIFNDKYMGMRFRFDRALVMPLRLLKQQMAGKAALKFAEAEMLVRKATGSDLSTSEPARDLFLEILEFAVHTPFGEAGPPVVLAATESAWALGEAVRRTQTLLRSGCPRGQTINEIRARLQGAGETKQMIRTVVGMLGSFPGVEVVEKRSVRATIETLTATADQVERILLEKLRPMSSVELSSELQLRVSRVWSRRKLCQILTNDQRFKSIGRTAMWTLLEWDLECGTVADVAAQVLHRINGCLTERQLFSLIGERRPVKLGSIRSLLREDRRFRRVAPGTWELL